MQKRGLQVGKKFRKLKHPLLKEKAHSLQQQRKLNKKRGKTMEALDIYRDGKIDYVR